MISFLCGLCLQPLPMMLSWQGSSPRVAFIYMILLRKHHLWLPRGLKQDKTSINQAKKELFLQTKYPKLQWVSLSSGCQRVKRSLLCLCLIWQALLSIICCQQNIRTMRGLPSLYETSLQLRVPLPFVICIQRTTERP